jgi:type I restriction enzyme R subunit
MADLRKGNFVFLKNNWPDLSSLASFAEMYAYSDPPSALVKLRIFAEKMADILYYELGLEKPRGSVNFRELLQDSSFRRAIPAQIISLLHLIRKEGNKGAHENETNFNSDGIIRLLKSVHMITIWFYSTITKTKPDVPAFIPPQKPIAMSELLVEKESLETKLKQLTESQENERNAHPKVEATEAILEETIQRGTEQAETIGLTEAQTRQLLIDSYLEDAGWLILDKKESYQVDSGKSQSIREYPVSHQPTKSGVGSIDYVLMGQDGIPIGVIEAKKTSVDAEVGKTQAELYASGLEKDTGKRPFIFYTNGHDIFFWDDQQYPPRQVWGFFDADKLKYLSDQRKIRHSLAETEINLNITERTYQMIGIRCVYEDFEKQRRKALIVMATGTGKTRVAVSLIDGLMRANWVKRVLFLVDRKELRKQAIDAFKEHLPDTPVVILTGETKKDRKARVYVSTYNAMMNAYAGFNVGFFDLIIADESHRSIYKYYRELFQYFDGFQIGLTATPVDFVARNTFSFFELQDRNPTFNFSLDEAVSHDPPYLVKPRINNESTGFLQRGIKYDDLTEEQRAQLEEQEENPELYQFEREDIDKKVLNKETNRKILQNLMENGIKNANGTRPGKTIIFARNRDHAYALQALLDEDYPQFKGKLSAVIEYKNPRAEELIEGFKGKKKEYADLDIAISVDMLDTGVDVPEVVNLVFAKPIQSKVKFWQMIGRGTRLCKKCLKPCEHKPYFLIFDPWRNFEFFDITPDGIEPREQISTPERLFNARLSLLQSVKRMNIGLQNEDAAAFLERTIEHLRSDIDQIPTETPSVRQRWQEMERVKKDSFWQRLDDNTFELLSQTIQPLSRWRQIQGEDDALRFDIKIARLQLAFLQDKADAFDTLQDSVIEDLERLRTNLNQVKQELDFIQEVQKAHWWQDVSLSNLEELRIRLRGLMKYRNQLHKNPVKEIDIADYTVAATTQEPTFEDNMNAYRQRVVATLSELVNSSLTIQKIRRGIPVTEHDIVSLQSLILERVPGLKPEDMIRLFPDKAERLDALIRSIVGMDELTVKMAFEGFRQTHTTLQANQFQFLTLVEQEIIRSGGLEVDRLYQQPFTSIHTLGLDGVFPGAQADELISVIKHLVG